MTTPSETDTATGGGPGRGRGRGRLPETSLKKDDNQSMAPKKIDESVTSPSSNPNASFQSASTPATSPSTDEKPRRSNPGQVMAAARGKGFEKFTSGFAAMTMAPISGGRSRFSYDIHSSQVPNTRPEHLSNKQGSNGNPIRLVANYVKILSNPTWELFVYHVDFVPEELLVDRRLRRELLVQHDDVLQDVAFSGQTIWAFQSLGEERTFDCCHPVTSEACQMKLRLVSKCSPHSPDFFSLINVIVRKLFEGVGLKLIGRNYYQFHRMISVGQNLRIFPGFLSSVNVYESTLLMNVDLCHKIVNKTTVYDCLQTIIASNDGNVTRAQDQATRELVGQIVWTKYNSRTYRLDDIDWDNSPEMKFEKKNGQEQTLIDYYHERYQIAIVDKDQPLIVSRPSKRDRRAGMTQHIRLIPELCLITGLSESVRKNFSLMKEISLHTHIDPTNRVQQLNKLINDIHENDQCQELLDKWDIQLDKEFIELNARIIDAESILYGDRVVQYNGAREPDWSQDGRAARHICPKNLRRWLVLFVHSCESVAVNFVNALHRVCRPFGMEIDYPRMISLENDRTETYLRELQNNIVNSQPIDFVLCVLIRQDRYSALKKFLCLDSPIPSQMVLAKTLSRPNQMMSIATKIGMQINAKLGGEIWSVNIPSKTLMIVGIDMFHKRNSISVGGFVATTNPQCTRFYSRVVLNQTSQELFDKLPECMTEALKAYHRANGTLPDRIIVYRDGVSDGDLLVVFEHELQQLIDTFSVVQPGYDPKFALVIVKKRGHARFFAKSSQNTFVNPPSGTVIDHTVTNTLWYDFYLISQCTRQGTISPTHYNVIWDRTNFKVDHMQRLTFKLCHLYYNWPGTIRVPAVCQYAHKLAFLAGEALHQVPHPSLADKLFYL